jgi:hypothetical protein
MSKLFCDIQNSLPATSIENLLTRNLSSGPKSATVPIYAAECTPPQIRGACMYII